MKTESKECCSCRGTGTTHIFAEVQPPHESKTQIVAKEITCPICGGKGFRKGKEAYEVLDTER